jgi:putative transposase
MRIPRMHSVAKKSKRAARFAAPPDFSGNEKIMAGSYTQIFIQVVFAVKHRQCLIDASWEAELYKYISGIIRAKGHKPLAINGMPDHIHIFIGMKPFHGLPELVREIKKSSNAFINERKLTPLRFRWQEGYGAFSYHRSMLSTVIRYIENQKTHHRRKSFRKEYTEFLERFEVEYDPAYLFDWLE